MTVTCLQCVHYDIDRKCEAFKKRIPDEIWEGESDHREPLEDQENDIVYEPINDD